MGGSISLPFKGRAGEGMGAFLFNPTPILNAPSRASRLSPLRGKGLSIFHRYRAALATRSSGGGTSERGQRAMAMTP